jgi:glucokinase
MTEHKATADPLPFPVLIGDIGGTNARFALIESRDSPIQAFPPVATADFPDIEAAVAASVLRHTPLRPRSAAIAVAGPVTGDEVDLTNAHWIVRPRDMMRRLGIGDVVLFNDFEALALALTALQPRDLAGIGRGTETPGAAKVVLGPGTGLGVAGLVWAAGLWVPVPGEGGHISLGPAEPDEFPVWAEIEPEFGRIAAEALLCGRGMVRLYRAVARASGAVPVHASPAEVSGAALSGADPVAVRTLDLYARLLGRVAGDIALIFMARGGVYIGGGISPRILPFLQGGSFRRAFEAKAPHEAVMGQMPTWVITRDSPALPGLAAFAREPESFGVSLAGRRWQTAG